MEHVRPNPVSETIRESRRLCELGDFTHALNLIRDITEIAESDRLRCETVRIHLICGDQASAATELRGSGSLSASGSNTEACSDVLAIQDAFVCVSTRGELVMAVQTADRLWRKHALNGNGHLENRAEVTVRVAYYALEIYDLLRRYGQGLRTPSFEPSGNLLQTLINRLLSLGLTFEAFEIIDYFTDDASGILSAVIGLQLVKETPSYENALIRLAKVHFENDDIESANSMLGMLDGLDLQNPLSKDKREAFILRFVDTEMDKPHRIRRLMELYSRFRDNGDFLTAMDALEHAASLHSKLGVNDATARLGAEIHDRLRSLCSRTNDQLSSIQFEFRRCDMISSTTTELATARTRRDELLALPICDYLPHFRKVHRRQCVDYLMVNQRDPALNHAEKYVDYCRFVGDEDEISLANNLRLTALVLPTRMSDEARESLLEDVQQELERGLEDDKVNARHIAYAEKALLLSEVLDEISQLQGEEREESWPSIANVLHKAEKVCDDIVSDPDGALLAMEISYLREVFSSVSSESINPGVKQASSAQIGGNTIQRNQNLQRSGARHSFSETRFIFDLILAVRSEDPAVFHTFDAKLKKEESRLLQESHILERSRFLLCRAVYLYVLTQVMNEPPLSSVHFEFETREEGLKKVLRTFEESIGLEAVMDEQVHDENSKGLIELLSLQAYHTAHLRALLFEVAASICFEMDDSIELWKWVQRSKARAYTTWLQKSLHQGKIKGPPIHQDLTFKEMAWVSSATNRTIFFIDWVVIHRDPMPPVLLLLALRFIHENDGPTRKLIVFETSASIADLQEQAHALNPARFDSHDWPRVLRGFNPVVEPLAEICHEGDILVLSPTSPLHNVPLHILGVDGKPLLERNPVVYVPSLSVLAACLYKLQALSPGAERSKTWKAAVLGAYEDFSHDADHQEERRQIYSSLHNLGERLGCTPLLGIDLDIESFSNYARVTDLVHFHGHASLSQHTISQQCLHLGPPNSCIDLEDAAAVDFKAAPHVNLIACSGGVQDFSLGGDEPLGLLSAFLAGGAASAVGALWPVQSATGRRFAELFFDEFLGEVDRSEAGPVVNLAETVRKACLRIRETPGQGATPYHWASFVLYGAWFCGRKPGTW